MATKKKMYGYTSEGRKKVYKWALGLKGKGQLKKIGAAMKKASKNRRSGSKVMIRQLGKIADLKKAYAQGYRAASSRRRKRK